MKNLFTKAELIERGFAPSAARAKMLIPFRPALVCTAFKNTPSY
jgi:hypothetical protein